MWALPGDHLINGNFGAITPVNLELVLAVGAVCSSKAEERPTTLWVVCPFEKR